MSGAKSPGRALLDSLGRALKTASAWPRLPGLAAAVGRALAEAPEMEAEAEEAEEALEALGAADAEPEGGAGGPGVRPRRGGAGRPGGATLRLGPFTRVVLRR